MPRHRATRFYKWFRKMMFMDPCPVVCNRCSTESKLPVKTLLSLSALCPSCEASLADIGREMRSTSDEFGTWVTLIGITVAVEEELGEVITDDELKDVATLRDMAKVVQRHLPPIPEMECRAIEWVLKAAYDLHYCSA